MSLATWSNCASTTQLIEGVDAPAVSRSSSRPPGEISRGMTSPSRTSSGVCAGAVASGQSQATFTGAISSGT